MTTWSRPAVKLAVIVGFQFALLLSVIGFKQYTSWTAETVLVKTEPVAAGDLTPGAELTVRYEISRLDASELAGADDDIFENGYVELQEGDDGFWHAVAIHWDRDHSFDGTVLLEGNFRVTSGGFGNQKYAVGYDIEDIRIPDEGISIPASGEIALAVEVRIDRFGEVVDHEVTGAASVDLSD